MRLVVTGASGQLGAHLMAGLSSRHTVVGLDRHRWWGTRPFEILQGDLLSPGFVESSIAAVSPEVIVHCAAMIDVDACERCPADADRMNGELTRRVARAAGPDCLVVYATTDGIFRGDQPFQTEQDLPCPRTVYGRSKLRGEWEVQIATANHLIIRTNFFGWTSGRKTSSAEWLYRALVEEQPLTAFDDFFFTPIYVVDLVERIGLLIETGRQGLFHVCGRDRLSKYEFVMRLAAAAALPTERVRRGSILEAGLAADRPRDMSLSSDYFRRTTGLDAPGCDQGLASFVRHRGVALEERFSPE